MTTSVSTRCGCARSRGPLPKSPTRCVSPGSSCPTKSIRRRRRSSRHTVASGGDSNVPSRAYAPGERAGTPLRRHWTIRHRREHGVPAVVLRPARGLFDPALDVGTPANGGGDLEMFFRVLKSGHALVYEPAAMVRHRHRRDYASLREQLASNGVGFYAYLVRTGAGVSRRAFRGSASWPLVDVVVERSTTAARVAAAPRLPARFGPGRVQGIFRRVAPLRGGPAPCRRRAPPVRTECRTAERHSPREITREFRCPDRRDPECRRQGQASSDSGRHRVRR